MISRHQIFWGSAKGWISALVLGLGSFYLNGLTVSAGWGAEFLLGGILPLVALRVLSPAQFITAAGLGASRTIFLWHHPHAWLIWTAEAAFLAAARRQKAPVSFDALFWVALGAPLLWLTYGQVMHLDEASLLLVIVKQAINGVLNVAVAELGYAVLLLVQSRASRLGQFPALPLGSLLLSLATCATLLPALLFMRIDAPARERAIRGAVELRLTRQLHLANLRVTQWVRSGRVASPLASLGGAEPATLLLGPSARDVFSTSRKIAAWEMNAGLAAPAGGGLVEVEAPPNFGVAPMTSALETAFVAAQAVDALPGWKLVAVTRGRGEILAQRQIQSDLLLTLWCILVLAIAASKLIASRMRRSLSRMASAVADLAALGGGKERIRDLVVEEFADTAQRMARSNSEFEREREALLVNRRRLQTISSHAPVVIYAINLKGEGQGALAFVSQTLEAVLGYLPGEVTNPDWWSQSLHPDDRQACLEANLRLGPGQVLTHEYRIRHRLGHYVWVYDCLTVEDDGNEAVGILFDVSEKRAAAEKLVQSSKMESLGRMAAGVAHELNQPLNFVRLAAENLRARLKAGNPDTTKTFEKIDLIIAQVDRAGGIVNEISSFGRVEERKLEQVDVANCVRDVVALLEVQFSVLDIDLDLVAQRQEYLVMAQPRRLSQVLLNLLLNARDAILTRREADGEHRGAITVRVEAARDRVKISVSDNGAGIAPDKLPLLFEPFFTAKAARKGTGLGLSISYGIISEFGGRIAAENIPFGARFIVTLPLRAAGQPDHADHADHASPYPPD